jgi:aerobic-type carbon monoxide dehydrogenase small subunit (CoxS/CutS family)
MIRFSLNGQETEFAGDEKTSLLSFLREEKGITSVKDGCSGQAACGACLIELDGKPALACSTSLKRAAGKKIITIEGFPENVRRTLGRAFVAKGAVQCGYCTPGILSRAKILLESNPDPSRDLSLHRLRQDYRCHPPGRPGPEAKSGNRLGGKDRHWLLHPQVRRLRKSAWSQSVH